MPPRLFVRRNSKPRLLLFFSSLLCLKTWWSGEVVVFRNGPIFSIKNFCYLNFRNVTGKIQGGDDPKKDRDAERQLVKPTDFTWGAEYVLSTDRVESDPLARDGRPLPWKIDIPKRNIERCLLGIQHQSNRSVMSDAECFSRYSLMSARNERWKGRVHVNLQNIYFFLGSNYWDELFYIGSFSYD